MACKGKVVKHSPRWKYPMEKWKFIREKEKLSDIFEG